MKICFGVTRPALHKKIGSHRQGHALGEQDRPVCEIECVKVQRRLATHNTRGVPGAVEDGNVGELVRGSRGLGSLLANGQGQRNTAARLVANATLCVVGTMAYVAGGLVKTRVSPLMPKAHGKAI